MSNFERKILFRQQTRKGAGTYTLDCGHQVAVRDGDWQPFKWLRKTFECPDCKKNAEDAAG